MRSLAVFVAVACLACHHSDPAPAPMPSNQPPPPPPRPATQPAESTGVAECDQLEALYAKWFDCDKVKQAGSAVIAATHDGVNAMKQGWASLDNATQQTKDAAKLGCTQGADALRQSARAMGCQL